jgi:hypothetical protein
VIVIIVHFYVAVNGTVSIALRVYLASFRQNYRDHLSCYDSRRLVLAFTVGF